MYPRNCIKSILKINVFVIRVVSIEKIVKSHFEKKIKTSALKVAHLLLGFRFVNWQWIFFRKILNLL